MTTTSDVIDIQSCHIHDHSSDDVTVIEVKARANTKELANTSKSPPTQNMSQIIPKGASMT